MDKKIFSKKFKELVNQQDISYVELSKKIGIRQDKLSKFANPNNSVNPSIDNLIALSKYFNTSIDDLLGMTPIPNEDYINEYTRQAFLPYDFLIKFFELNKLIPLNIESYSETRNVSNHFQDFNPQTFDEALETYEAELVNIKLTCTPCNTLLNRKSLTHDEIISKFLLDWQKVKEASISTEVPELEQIWIDKKLEDLKIYCFEESIFA